MDKYPKIQTVFLRDPDNKFRTLLEGQYAKDEFAFLAANEWVFTEKIDGTNIRVGWDTASTAIGGKTDRAQIPVYLYDEVLRLLPASKFESIYPETPMTLYGEGYGAKIQKGGGNYIPDGVSFILFDIKINGNWLSRENVADIAEHLGIDVVPVIGRGPLQEAVALVRAGFQSNIGRQIAEGLVMRPACELLDRRGQRIISKIKYKDFTRK